MAIILAIDLGNYNSVFCGYDPSTGEVEFRTAATTPAAVRAELRRRPVERVVIEACSPAGWVHDLCGGVRDSNGARLDGDGVGGGHVGHGRGRRDEARVAARDDEGQLRRGESARSVVKRTRVRTDGSPKDHNFARGWAGRYWR
jgi:hypothetical protein